MKAPLNVAVRGLFATPVAALEVPDAEARNVQLKALERRRNAPSIQASDAGGWHSDREVLDWGGEPVAEVLA